MADDVRIYVTGLTELRRDLKRIDPEMLVPLRENLKAAAEGIAKDASSKVPVGSASWDKHPGAAAGSIRVTAGGSNVYIVGGKAKSQYYGWLDFGGVLKPDGARRNTQSRDVIRKGRFLYPAIARHSKELELGVAKAFDTAARKAGFS